MEGDAGELSRQGGIKDDVLLDEPLVTLVDTIIPFKQDARTIGKIEVAVVGVRFLLRVAFHFLDDGVRHGVWRETSAFDLEPREEIEELVRALEVARRS